MSADKLPLLWAEIAHEGLRKVGLGVCWVTMADQKATFKPLYQIRPASLQERLSQEIQKTPANAFIVTQSENRVDVHMLPPASQAQSS